MVSSPLRRPDRTAGDHGCPTLRAWVGHVGGYLCFPLPFPLLFSSFPWPFPAALPVPPELLPEAPALPALPLSAVLLGAAVARASCSEQYAATLSFPPAAVTSRCQARASSALPRSLTCS